MKLKYIAIIILSLIIASSMAVNSADTSNAQFISDFIFVGIIIFILSSILHLIKIGINKGGELINGS